MCQLQVNKKKSKHWNDNNPVILQLTLNMFLQVGSRESGLPNRVNAINREHSSVSHVKFICPEIKSNSRCQNYIKSNSTGVSTPSYLTSSKYSFSSEYIPKIGRGDRCLRSKSSLFTLAKHFIKYGCTAKTFLLFDKMSNNSSLLKK